MRISDFLSSAQCHLAILALLHSLWQGVALSAGVWVGLRVLPARRPHLRYAVALGGLVVLALCIPATYAILARPAGETGRASVHGASGLVELVPLWAPAPEPAPAAPASSPLTLAGAVSPQWTAVAAVIWLGGFATMLLRMVAHLRGAACLLHDARPADQDRLLERLARCRRRLNWQGRLRVFFVEQLPTPAVVGIIRPALLLPASLATDLPIEYLDAILLHELAHLRRHDFLVNLGQMLLEAALFFNPMVWWLSRQVRVEREACCDALAADAVGEPTCMAQALEAVVRSGREIPALALAASGGDSRGLLDRVRRLLLPGYRPDLRLNGPALTACLAVGLLLIVATWQGTRIAVAAAADMLSPQERIDQIATLQEAVQVDPHRDTIVYGSATASGTLTTEDGSPLADIHYISGRIETAYMTSQESLPLKQGTFSCPIAAGEVTLWASQKGFAPAVFGPVHVNDKQDLRDIHLVLKRGFTARVHLLDQAGKPVADAKVTATYAGKNGMTYGEQTLKSDKSGWLAIPNACELPMTLQCKQPGFQDVLETMTFVPDKLADFRVAAAKTLRGSTVAQKDGKPVASARVVAMLISGRDGNCSYHPRSEWAPLLATSDSAGQFVLNTLRDDSLYNLCILADGYTPKLLYGISSASKPLAIKLAPALHIRGKIIGSPEQLRKLLIGDDGKARIQYNETVMVEEHSGYGQIFSSPATIKGNQATFDITGFVPGAKRLDLGKLQPAIEATSDVNDVVIDLNKSQDAIVAAGKTRKVRVTLVPPAGSPPPQGSIKLFSFKTVAAEALEPTQVPLNNGVAEFDAPLGKEISVECGTQLAGYWFADSEQILIEDAATPKEVSLAVSPAGAVHGTVLSVDGAPARHSSVSLVAVGSAARPTNFPALQPVSCDGAGQFVLTPVALEGEYRLTATAQGSDAHVLGETFKVTGAKPIVQADLRFHPGIDVTVSVVSPEGNPVPGAKIEFQLQATPTYGAGLSERRTGGDGKAVARQLDPAWPGELQVTVQPAADYQALITSVPFSVGPHRITLQKAHRFDGILLDAGNKPVSNIEVRFVAADYTAKHPWIYTRTDAEGKFSASTLPPIAYRLYFDGCYRPGTTFTPNPATRYDINEPAGEDPIVKIPAEAQGTFHVVVAPWARKGF